MLMRCLKEIVKSCTNSSNKAVNRLLAQAAPLSLAVVTLFEILEVILTGIKQFYSKQEEKIHVKEMEKNNLQAKYEVETLEAEIRMFRKKLTFKTTPMPIFYQGPPPPKADLKKLSCRMPLVDVPLIFLSLVGCATFNNCLLGILVLSYFPILQYCTDTNNKSLFPKLGRRKSLPPAVSEKNVNTNGRSSRFSLDEKVPQNNDRGPSPVYPKKPQRKSLPRLPNFCCGELLVLLEQCLVFTVLYSLAVR
ncbi:hypothetical protein TB1_042335 [Malus domestica]